MTIKLLDESFFLGNRRQFGLSDDFLSYTDTGLWTKTDADSGASVAIDADGVGGILVFTTAATDNNEAYIETTNELFLFAADTPIIVEARLQYAEANTDDANVMLGLMDAPGANSIVDDGAGPKSSYSGMVMFTEDGQTLWTFETSLAGTQTTTQTDVTAGGAGHAAIRMIAQPVSSTEIECTPWIDTAGGSNFKHMRDSKGNLIKHSITLGSPTQMAGVVGVKAGGANSEVVNLDYFDAQELR